MVSMVYQLCSPASARTKQEAGRLLCGSSRVKVVVRAGHSGTESQRELSVLRMYESGRKASQKPPFLSRLGLARRLCFVGVAGNSNRGVSISFWRLGDRRWLLEGEAADVGAGTALV